MQKYRGYLTTPEKSARMSRQRNKKSNLLSECISQNNAIDFVQNVPLGAEASLSSSVVPGVLEGPPAFLEAQGIRYIPAPLEAGYSAPPVPSLAELEPEPEHLSAPMSALQLQERVDSTVRKCMQSQMSTAPMRSSRMFSEYNTSPTRRMASEYAPAPTRLSARRLPLDTEYRPTASRRGMANPYDDEDDSHERLKRLHAEIVASTPPNLRPGARSLGAGASFADSDDGSHRRLQKLHAEIMASTPPGIRNKLRSTAQLDAGWDSDDQICDVVRPRRRAVM